MLTLVMLLLVGLAFGAGLRRARAVSGGEPASLHSRPVYYGGYVALWCGVPAFSLLLLWTLGGSVLIESLVRSGLPPEVQALPPERLELFMRDVSSLARGELVSEPGGPALESAAAHQRELEKLGGRALAVVGLSLAVAGLAYARRRIHPLLRARESVERAAGSCSWRARSWHCSPPRASCFRCSSRRRASSR